MSHSTASFCRERPIPLIRRKMLQCRQQVGAESSTQRISPLDGVPREELGKKVMRQISCCIFITPVTTQKRNHRRIIRLTQFTERRPRLRLASA